MANWCDNQIKITGDKSVKDLYKNIKKWINEDGSYSLAGIVEKAGFDYNSVSCRGIITDFYLDNLNEDEYRIVLYQETAWGPNNKMWKLIIDKYCPEAEFIYTAEEPGNEVYVSNDPDVANTYMLDWADDCQYGLSRQEMFDILFSKLKEYKPNINFKVDEISVDEIIEMLEAENYEIYYHFFEFDENPFES